MYDIIGSIVLYKNDPALLEKTITSFLKSALNTHLFILDNSPNDSLKGLCLDKRIDYIFNSRNLGFGSAHNIALKKMIKKTKYSLLLNPDVYFQEGTLEKLFDFMETNCECGSVMPKVLYPDGSLQYLCRLLPDPLDMFLRKMETGIFNIFLKGKRYGYEMRRSNYNKVMNVPYLSGCFMFIRTDVFEKVGIFDERYFLYFEDVDLARRIHKIYPTVYLPNVVIYHAYERDSNKNISSLYYIISSGMKYFNKWGWFFDFDRKVINERAKKEYLQ